MDFLDITLSLLALILLEVILGIDNLVFLSILTEKLPPEERRDARKWGLFFAWMTRLLLLGCAVWFVTWTKPLFSIYGHAVSGHNIFLFLGGLFLLTKATQEIHNEVEETHTAENPVKQKHPSKYKVIIQIGLMDIIFSLDSVLTAVGLTKIFLVMATAITFAIIIMLYASETVSRIIHRYPTIKMLGLCFLMLIGMVLIADSFDFNIPRNYIYFAMAFSLGVELLNHVKRVRIKRKNRLKK